MDGMRAQVDGLRAAPLDRPEKGFRHSGGPGAPSGADLARRAPTLFGGDFFLPLLTLSAPAVRHNIAAMAAWCDEAGARLAPHAKTTMAPALVGAQLDAGAWAMTAAHISQVQVLRRFGVRRVILANELVDPAGIAWLAGELGAGAGFEFFCWVDSVAGAELLDRGLRAAGFRGRCPVLVELGHAGGRTGCRSEEEALTVAASAAALGSLRLAGVAGYEGTVGHDRQPETVERVRRYCRQLGALARAVVEGRLVDGEPVVTAGGSVYFDVVAGELAPVARELGGRLVLRSGSYVTHDSGFYATVTPGANGAAGVPVFRPALELYAHVVSRPEPTLALLCAGRRDVPFDEGLPLPLRLRRGDGGWEEAAGLRVIGLNDQHAFVAVPAGSAVAPGDVMCLGLSHPCTAFDKWRAIPLVEGERVVDVIHTFF